jgi:hypothetical protein
MPMISSLFFKSHERKMAYNNCQSVQEALELTFLF